MADISEKITNLINIVHKTIGDIRSQFYWKTGYNMSELNSRLTEFVNEMSGQFEEDIWLPFVDILKEIVEVQQQGDYVLLADILEMSLLQSLLEYQMSFIHEGLVKPADFFDKNFSLLSEENCENCNELKRILVTVKETDEFPFSVELTNCGAVTIKGKVYYHSNVNPYMEGRQFANAYSDGTSFDYTVYGLGFMYHISELIKKDERYAVTGIESDIRMIYMCFKYIDMSQVLESKRFKLVYIKQLSEISGYIKGTRFLIHYPSMIELAECEEKQLLKAYFITLNTTIEQRGYLDTNYYYNHVYGDESVDKIKDSIEGKTVIYIGGGPSAQSKLQDILRYRKDEPESVLICAGTVYRKLLEQNVIPDYVVIIDPLKSMIKQLENIPETDTKLIYMITASKEAVREFKGKRYAAYQVGYDKSEEWANISGAKLFESGGSVSTFVVDFALRLGCRRLITTGLDLGFPKNKTHAFGLSQDIKSDEYGEYVECVLGGRMETSKVFNAYRVWIEKRVADTPAELINLTEGAVIKGMKNVVNL